MLTEKMISTGKQLLRGQGLQDWEFCWVLSPSQSVAPDSALPAWKSQLVVSVSRVFLVPFLIHYSQTSLRMELHVATLNSSSPFQVVWRKDVLHQQGA